MAEQTTNTIMPTVAAIIPTYRRWPCLLATVKMLLAQTRVPDEIIIVDQTDSADIPDDLRTELQRLEDSHRFIRYVRQEEALVYRARNLALRHATSDCLLYLDDDIEIDDDFVANHMMVAAETGADAVVGLITTPAIGLAWVPAPPRNLSPVEYAFRFNPRVATRVEGISHTVAGNLLIKRAVLVAVGGWDENIATYGDKDLGLRLVAAGYRIVYDPAPKMTHLQAPVGGTRLTDAKAPWPGWQRCASIHYLAFRHMRGRLFVKHGLLRAARHSFLLRQNAIRPWCWLPEFWGWLKGMRMAYQWAKTGPALPFVAQNTGLIETAGATASTCRTKR